MYRVLVQRGGEEERTAGSDQKIRYSSGGPISLDPSFNIGWFMRIEMRIYVQVITDGF
jgi:hypothetical protein